MRRLLSIVSVVGGLVLAARAAEPLSDRAQLDAEDTYELRLERILRAKGTRAVVELLAHEVAERPRPYVKAWYANYLLYGQEFGVPDVADPKRGFALAKDSRAEGSLFGLELVGRAWGDGRGAPFRDTQTALACLREAAARGRPSAMAELSKYYFFGIGVARDRVAAERWARDASRRGAAIGLANLADWLDDPQYAGTPDHVKSLALRYEGADLGNRQARQLLQTLAEKGDPVAEKYVRLDYVASAMEGAASYPAQLRKTVAWLEQHAADDPLVQLRLAELMIERQGPVYDAKAAREKLQRAAAAGVDDAQAVLAEMAWRGIGEKRNRAAAVAAWKELAAKGNARALGRMGWLHWWGEGVDAGVPKDAAVAFDLSRRAADLGYWEAQFNTAECYTKGIGTEVNYYLAAKYYAMLDRRGYFKAGAMRDDVLARIKD